MRNLTLKALFILIKTPAFGWGFNKKDQISAGFYFQQGRRAKVK